MAEDRVIERQLNTYVASFLFFIFTETGDSSMIFVLSKVRSLFASFLAIFLVGVLSLSLSFGMNVQTSSADVSTPEQALQEIKKDQASESPTQAYEEMTKVVEDPKVGIEKEYEKKEQEYFESHPDSAGLIEKTKELVNSVTESK
jgi:hypothetical protein